MLFRSKHTHTHTNTHTHTHKHTHIHTHKHTHIHTRIHTHAYTHAYTHTHTHTYTHTYTHTCTHAFLSSLAYLSSFAPRTLCSFHLLTIISDLSFLVYSSLYLCLSPSYINNLIAFTLSSSLSLFLATAIRWIIISVDTA